MLLKANLLVRLKDQLALPGDCSILDSVLLLKIVFILLCRREFSFDPTTLKPDLCKVDLEVFKVNVPLILI